MPWDELSAVIVAAATALATVIATTRNLKGDKTSREVAVTASGLSVYSTLTTTLQADLERVRAEHAEDRKQWVEDKAELRREHDEDIKELHQVHAAAMLEAGELIEVLRSEVYALKHRPPETRDRVGE